jgi:hypothetical protein
MMFSVLRAGYDISVPSHPFTIAVGQLIKLRFPLHNRGGAVQVKIQQPYFNVGLSVDYSRPVLR